MVKTYMKFRTPQGASFNPWYGRIDITDLTADLNDSTVAEVAGKVADVLDALPPAQDEIDFMFVDAVEAFRDAADEDDVDVFDEALTVLYDWGDDRRFIIKALAQ